MDPIRVADSSLPDQLWSGLHHLAASLTAFALGRGWLASDEAVLLGVLGGVVWPVLAAQLHVRRRAGQLAALAGDPGVPQVLAK